MPPHKAAAQAQTDSTVAIPKASTPGQLLIRCPQCLQPICILLDGPLADIECSTCGSHFSLVDDACDTRMAASVKRLGQFELIERVGVGAFGTVWKARDTQLQRTVAIKIPRKRDLGAAEMQQFLREARNAARLNHPGIVKVHEVGRHEGGIYLVTEYVKGLPLSDWIAHRRPSIHEAAALMQRIAEIVHHAHEAGVVHRDLKPHNVLVDTEGEPHVADFGLARQQATDITMTVEGQLLGTPAYMSPEQALGEGHRADRRSDVYSLGVMLFQLITGELPFRGGTNVLVHQVLNDDPPSPRKFCSRLPKDLETITLKCLEKAPNRRYATAQDLADELRRFLAGEPIHARRVSHLGRGWRWCKRNPVIASLACAVFVVLLAGALASSYFALRAQRSADAAEGRTREAVSLLYQSFVREIQATRAARREGYRETVWSLIRTARSLEAPASDAAELRAEAVATMGDFVGHAPITITGFDAEVRDTAVSRDGSLLAVGLGDGSLRLFHTASGLSAADMHGSPSSLELLAFLPSGDELLAANANGLAQIWRRDSSDRWTSSDAFDIAAPVRAYYITRQADWLVALGDAEIHIWNVAAKKQVRAIKVDELGLLSVAIDSQGKFLAAGFQNENDSGVIIWDLETGEVQQRIDVNQGKTYPNAIAFSDDSKLLAAGFDGALVVFETSAFSQVSRKLLDATKAVAFSVDGQCLAAVDIRGRVTIWSAGNDRELASLTNWRKTVSRETLKFSPDGVLLAASNIGQVRLWRLVCEEKSVLHGHTGGVPAVAYSPDARALASAGKDSFIRLWDPETGKAQPPIGQGAAVQSIAWAADGRLLASACWQAEGEQIALLDVPTRQTLAAFDHPLGWIYWLSLFDREGGPCLAACGEEGVAVWRIDGLGDKTGDGPTLKLLRHEPAKRCLHLAVSPDGHWLAWVYQDRQIRLWNLRTLEDQPLHAPAMNQGWQGLAFRPDGDQLVFVDARGVVQVWNVQQDAGVFQLGQPGDFNAPHLALSADGRRLAALSESSSVAVWDLPTRRKLLQLPSERNAVWSLAWNRSGDDLAVGLSDGNLAIWRIRRLRQQLAAIELDWTEPPAR